MDIRLRDNPIHQETLENTIDEHLSSAERERVIYRVQAEVLNNGLIAFENAQEMERKLVDYYNQAGKNIKKEILDLYERIDEWDVAELNKYNRLNNLLEKVKYQANLMGSKEKLAVTNGLKDVYKDQYIRNIYALGKAINVKADLTMLNPKMIEKAISYPWSGAMFSDRIWDNKNKLVKNIREAILQSAVMGEGMDKIAKRINVGLENSYKNALRVARTETMRVAYVAEMDSLESNKSVIDEVEHSAFWDKRTCKTCKGLDEKVYKVGKERMLPIHPHCRCTYLPVIPRIQEGDLSRYAEKARKQEYGEFREDIEKDLQANLNAGRKKKLPEQFTAEGGKKIAMNVNTTQLDLLYRLENNQKVFDSNARRLREKLQIARETNILDEKDLRKLEDAVAEYDKLDRLVAGGYDVPVASDFKRVKLKVPSPSGKIVGKNDYYVLRVIDEFEERAGGKYYIRNKARVSKADLEEIENAIEELIEQNKRANGVKFSIDNKKFGRGDANTVAFYSPNSDTVFLRSPSNTKKNFGYEMDKYLDTVAHELGHRLHNYDNPAVSKLVIDEDSWDDWKASVEPFYKKYRRNDEIKIKMKRFDYPINAEDHYKDRDKAHVYKEMFAESSAVVLRGGKVEKEIFDEVFDSKFRKTVEKLIAVD